ncbi:CAMK protein kinase [Saprolegnia parasitica CBS 223.65]|uniref:CAMK protein kinase n=1 Tax=Saprolegnia parasitica (strain CBS 223.65) TaxID=695850 RepID=A0A067C6A7_SAPPC|nr:CAMK protein kinase [Saprolegnia parasitica CBS 223.65]KDO22337.1 CAMK protein kinase [Saprolegnia parasitica CBS 223.65]|eukprot:XP_012206971.1 CAMK protein kinase [Saprolegnia parasitica CBS 223.65]
MQRPSLSVAAWAALTKAPCTGEPVAIAPYVRPSLEDVYDIDRSALLAAGGSAYLVRGQHKASGHAVAIKRMTRTVTNSVYALKDVRGEIACLRALQGHPHIVRLLDHFDDVDSEHGDDRTISLVLELAAHGDLLSYVTAHGPLSEAATKHIALQLLDALDAMHAHGIVHRDLKLENILVTAVDPHAPWKLTVQVADFGFATSCRHPLTRQCGTDGYMAPEMCRKQAYGASIDVFSLGVVVHAMLLHRLPFDGADFSPILTYGTLSADARDFVQQLLQLYPAKRATIAAARAHPWLVDTTAFLEAGFVQQLAAFVLEHQLVATNIHTKTTSRPGLDLLLADCFADEHQLPQLAAHMHDVPLLRRQLPSLVAACLHGVAD